MRNISTFRDLLSEYGVPYRVAGDKHARQGWLQLSCPHCGGEWYMGYSLHGHFVNCWRCGRKDLGDTFALLARLQPAAARTALKGLHRDFTAPSKPQGRLTLPKGLGPLEACHIRYLRGRGFDPDALVKLWGLQGIGLASRLAWRIFIPIEHKGRVVSWTTRAVKKDADVRYISAGLEEESYPHKELIYGADYCRHAIITVEGPVDVWRIGPGAGCTFGLGHSSAQVRALADYPVRVICFDNEPAAQVRANKLADTLAVYPGETYNVVLSAKDAGEAPEEEIQELRSTFLL